MTHCLIAAMLLLPQQPVATQPAIAASASGVVLSDDATPLPLRHARVELTGVGTQTVITGDDGTFAFSGVNPGRYELSVSKPGLGRRAYSANLSSPAPTIVALAPGQQLTGLRVVLPRGGVVSGVITDAAGEPVHDARVFAVEQDRPYVPSSFTQPRVAAVSDDEGRYRLFGLTPGSYLIRVTQPREPDAIDTYYPGVGSPRDALIVAVGAREERFDVDVVAMGGNRVTVSGSLQNAAGAAVDSVVQLSRIGAGADGEELKTEARDGIFVFRKVSPGSYELQASNASSAVVETIDVSNRSEIGITLVLRPTAVPASGPAAEVGGLGGRISTAGGQGAPEFAIVVMNANRQTWAASQGRPIVVWPDTNGDWSIEALAVGDYLVAALGEVHPSDLTRPDFLAAVAAGSVTVGVKAGVTTHQDLTVR